MAPNPVATDTRRYMAFGSDNEIFFGLFESLAQAKSASPYVAFVEEWSGPPFRMTQRWAKSKTIADATGLVISTQDVWLEVALE